MAGALRVISRPARPRPARVRAGRLRRRRPAARERGRRADGLLPGHRPALARAAVRARRPRGRLPQRVRPDADPAHRGGERRGASREILDDLEGRARDVDGRARASPAERPAIDVRRRHALPRPGLRDPGPPLGARRARRARRSASTGSTSSCTASACRTPRPRSSTCARSATARADAELPSAERRQRRVGAIADERAILFEGSGADAIYDRAKLRPGAPLRRPGDRDRVRLHDRRPPGYGAEVDRYFNILIRPAA